MTPSTETFEQFYASRFGYRQAELARIADPKRRAVLEAWEQENKERIRGYWEKVRAARAAFQSSVSEEEQWERRQEYKAENWTRRGIRKDNGTYWVINGEAA
jgi:hypothetical protein